MHKLDLSLITKRIKIKNHYWLSHDSNKIGNYISWWNSHKPLWSILRIEWYPLGWLWSINDFEQNAMVSGHKEYFLLADWNLRQLKQRRSVCEALSILDMKLQRVRSLYRGLMERTKTCTGWYIRELWCTFN